MCSLLHPYGSGLLFCSFCQWMKGLFFLQIERKSFIATHQSQLTYRKGTKEEEDIQTRRIIFNHLCYINQSFSPYPPLKTLLFIHFLSYIYILFSPVWMILLEIIGKEWNKGSPNQGSNNGQGSGCPAGRGGSRCWDFISCQGCTHGGSNDEDSTGDLLQFHDAKEWY